MRDFPFRHGGLSQPFYVFQAAGSFACCHDGSTSDSLEERSAPRKRFRDFRLPEPFSQGLGHDVKVSAVELSDDLFDQHKCVLLSVSR